MKKLLITFLILLSPLVSAQTEICEVNTTDYGWGPVLEVIKDRGCETNDVLQLTYRGEVDLDYYFAEQISRWCRLDTHIQIYGDTLVCRLVSNEPREYRLRKSRS